MASVIAWWRGLSLPEAVRRLTALPAARIGLKDRGTLAPGHHADITVFDADAIASRWTVQEPRRYATGIAHVVVNGGVAFRDGRRTETDSGRVLRRG